MLATEITKENIEKMVLTFYVKVLKDDIVGPFFIAKLGDDMNSEYWKPHLEILINFWSSMILGDGTYTGNPFAPHTQLGELNREVFEQWLKLFFETLDEVYEPLLGNAFKERSMAIAGNFMRNLRIE
ncbi:MAG TPA: group III truncated hemoglobin [Campylobacterales bacterium]|nr:group III truncated hemoglobin [Campylobacterales bacterium]